MATMQMQLSVVILREIDVPMSTCYMLASAMAEYQFAHSCKLHKSTCTYMHARTYTHMYAHTHTTTIAVSELMY